MKKIKYLLLWIVSLLWIGCSFSDSNIDFYIDYFTNNWWLTSYNLSTRSSYSFCSLWINSYSYSTNINDYFSWCPSSFYNNWFGVYFNDNWNKLTYYLPWKTLSWWQYGSVLVISNNLADSSIWDISNGAYSRILWNVNCLWTGIFQTWNFCDSSFVELFTNKYYTISSLWNIYDSDYNWVHYNKWPVAPSVWLWYSFWFVDWSGWQYEQVGWHRYYLNTWDIFHFRTITFSGSTIYPIDWPLIFRLNNTTNLSVWDSYKIIALGPTWDYQDFSFIYSIYNCSSSATRIFDCSFLEGWDIAENFDLDFTMPSNINKPYTNLIYFLTSFWPVKFNNSYSLSDNTLSLSSHNGWSLNSNSITLNLIPSATWFDIIDNIEDNSWWGWNDWNDVEPIFDYNSYVINDLIICYITSWEICPYSSFNRSAFESSFDVSESVWNWTSWFLIWNNAYLFLKEFCLNSSFIDYAYCSQLDLYSWSFITIDYVNWLLSYDIYWDWIVVSIAWLWSWQLWNVSCWGWNCSSVNTWLPNFVRPSDSDYYAWNFIDTWYFENFFNLQLTWYFMKCPRSYESNRVVIWQSVMNYLWGRDPFVFINCSIAAFNNWKSFNFLDRIDFPGPLMDLSWNNNILWFSTDSNKRLLFWFFDCLLAFGMLLIIRFFYHLFK